VYLVPVYRAGVYVPCCLSMFGIILFQRLVWIVGQGGVWWTLGMLGLSEALVLVTVLSMSAISTNGAMRGGGSYFMISRTLGESAIDLTRSVMMRHYYGNP
jgi:hypothetical protein